MSQKHLPPVSFFIAVMMIIAILIPVAAQAADGLNGPVEPATVEVVEKEEELVLVVPEKPKIRTTSCAHITNVNPDYLPFVKGAADKWLEGDQNIILALIQTESKWDAAAKNRSSSASGLGQFINGTARAYPEFVGGSDVLKNGKRVAWQEERIWEAGTIFDDPKKNFPNDARFSPERSIYAVAHKMSGAMARSSNLLHAYAMGYHGFKAGDEKTKNTAYGAGNKVVAIYKQLQKNGGCQLVEK